MAKNTGKNFENEIRRSLKGAKCFWFRIQDTNDVSRYVKKAVAEKQPGDFFAVYRSTPILIECKTTRNLTAFPLYYGATRSIPKHQVDYGKTLQRNGGISLLLLRRDEPRNKIVYALTPEQVAYLYRTFGNDRKSVPWKWIEEHSTVVERLAKPIRWNLTKLFTAIL